MEKNFLSTQLMPYAKSTPTQIGVQPLLTDVSLLLTLGLDATDRYVWGLADLSVFVDSYIMFNVCVIECVCDGVCVMYMCECVCVGERELFFRGWGVGFLFLFLGGGVL